MPTKKQIALFVTFFTLLLLSLSCNLPFMADDSPLSEDGLVQDYHPVAALEELSQYTLSTAQQEQLAGYGYPDRFVIFFFDEMLADGQSIPMRQESWYYDAPGYEIVFRNGDIFTERTGDPIQIEGLGSTVYAPQGFTAGMTLDAVLAIRGETGFYVQNTGDDLLPGKLIFIQGLAAGFEDGRLTYVETLPLGAAGQ